MKQIKVRIEDWAELYQAFFEFKDLECWDWLFDSDLFGVQNPEDQRTGYCCIMGKLGRYKAMALYLGTEGLESYLRICSGAAKSRVFNPELHQKCLMASLESSSQLEAEDFEIIGKLGLEFKNDEYPMFRNHMPGYMPWILNYYDVKFLTIALQQAVNVANRCKKSKKLLESKSKDQFLVRVLKDGHWHDQYLPPGIIEKREIKPIIDQSSYDQLKDLKIKEGTIWELGRLSVETPIREGNERPYYPYIIVIVDREEQKPIGFEISDFIKINAKLPSLLINTCIEVEYLPEKIIVQKDIFDLIKMMTKSLKIKALPNKKLKILDTMIDSLVSIIMSEEKIV